MKINLEKINRIFVIIICLCFIAMVFWNYIDAHRYPCKNENDCYLSFPGGLDHGPYILVNKKTGEKTPL